MAKNNNVLVSVKNLETKFNNKGITKTVHKKIDLDIIEGETISIIGANGAGKTVLVETIANIRDIQKGEITFSENINPSKEIGIQFQNEDGNIEMITPRNAINFFKKYFRKVINEDEVNEMIEKFGIFDFLDTRLDKLSGGQKQRLNLLLAMMNKPKLIILDEFTTGLDITSVIGILNYIIDFKKKNNSTLIIVTHSPKEIKMLADRVVLIKDGIISNEMTTKEIDKKYNGDFEEFLIQQMTLQ